MAERELSPVKGVFPNGKKIVCKDCIYRDKTVVHIGKKKLDVGTTKAFCDAYLPPPTSNGKPTEVLFNGADCKFYQKEVTA